MNSEQDEAYAINQAWAIGIDTKLRRFIRGILISLMNKKTLGNHEQSDETLLIDSDGAIILISTL